MYIHTYIYIGVIGLVGSAPLDLPYNAPETSCSPILSKHTLVVGKFQHSLNGKSTLCLLGLASTTTKSKDFFLFFDTNRHAPCMD